MASHDYYNGGKQQPTPSPYFNEPSPGSTPAPPYQATAQPDYSVPDSSIYPPGVINSGPSHQTPYSPSDISYNPTAAHAGSSNQVPFSPNDISYTPAGSYNNNNNINNPANQNTQGRPDQSPFDTVFDDNAYPMNSRPTPGSSTGDLGQQNLYQDTGYYGGASNGHGQEEIPLQNQPHKDVEMNDHVYDAPGGSGRRPGTKSKKGKVRLGELGMMGSNKKRIPWVVYIFTLIQVGVFIAEIVRNAQLTGSPIMIKPQFNPMIGPSSQVLINMGARYAPCMHNVEGIQDSKVPVLFLCPNATKNDQTCDLNVLCGFGGNVPNPVFDGEGEQDPAPNQWYRFIIPIFMHAGLIHIGFNLLLQLTIAKEMEMAIGSIRFFLVYMSAGIFGFVMGGNYAAPGIASTGASGSLFGIIALILLDLFYSWKERRHPVKDLLFIILDMVIAFVLGLLPGLDNFSHIGGFLMGLALGVCVLHSPNSLRRKMGQDLSYAAVSPATGETPPPFFKNPIGFFKGRKPLWWAWWLVRAGFLVMIIVVFIVLLNNFYSNHSTCEWCKYLSCIPVNNWCELGTIQQNS